MSSLPVPFETDQYQDFLVLMSLMLKAAREMEAFRHFCNSRDDPYYDIVAANLRTIQVCQTAVLQEWLTRNANAVLHDLSPSELAMIQRPLRT